MIDKEFAIEAVRKFSGCDNGEAEAGSAADPSIWMFGIEHGTYKGKHDDNPNTRQNIEDDSYSIERQLTWPYNQKAFKLLASMLEEYGVKKYKEFALDYQPFVIGQKGYFKGNLYPFPCNREKIWSEKAITITGFSNKKEYLKWCLDFRLPVIKSWVDEYSPKVFIGIGIGHRDKFSLAVFGKPINLIETTITINNHKKRLFHYIEGKIILVVLPHFSGSYGLNSNESLQKAGEFIADVIKT